MATHNSGTGERSKGLLSWLVMPFSRCQKLTIREQFEKGVRFFDLRAKKTNGGYIVQHGLWKASMSLNEAIKTIGELAASTQETAYVILTYEGRLENANEEEMFKKDMHGIVSNYSYIILSSINVKLPEWRTLETVHPVYVKQSYTKIVGWKILLPIPFLWWLLSKKEEFKDEYFTMVDFVC